MLIQHTTYTVAVLPYFLPLLCPFFIVHSLPHSSSPCRQINAAVQWSSNSQTYFFSKNEYILYDNYHLAEKDVFPVSHLHCDFPTNIDAAAQWFDFGVTVYLKSCDIFLVSIDLCVYIYVYECVVLYCIVVLKHNVNLGFSFFNVTMIFRIRNPVD